MKHKVGITFTASPLAVCKNYFGVGGCNVNSNYPTEVTKAGWAIANFTKHETQS